MAIDPSGCRNPMWMPDGSGYWAASRGDVVPHRPFEVQLLAQKHSVSDEPSVRCVEKSLQFQTGPARIQATPDDRMKAGIPVPLPVVVSGTRRGEAVVPPILFAFPPVLAQDPAAQFGDLLGRTLFHVYLPPASGA